METINVIITTADNTWKKELYDLDPNTEVSIIQEGAQEKAGIPSTTPCNLILQRTEQKLTQGTLASAGVKSGDTLILVPQAQFGFL
jgi:hypothetical protein